MGERGEEGVARPGEKGSGERGGRKGLSALHSTELCFSGEKQNSHWLDFDRRCQHSCGSVEHKSVKCIYFIWPCEEWQSI